MASVAEWIEGARPRTLPNSIAPVLVGAGAAAAAGGFSWGRTVLAMVVSVALQVGVNYANDYSDGIRGTDADRVGPMRLVGSEAATPRAVLTAALTSFGVAALAGLGLVALSGYWWLLAIGAVCIAGAWFYTGGSRPYGYSGWGEAAVFLFFGLIGVLGTLYVQIGRITLLGLLGAIAVGAFSAAVLVANNLRDVPTDRESGKRTMAVRLGEQRTRVLYFALVAIPFVVSIVAALATAWTLAGLLALLVVARAARSVAQGVKGMALIPVLRDTSFAMLAWAALTTAALAIS